MDVELEAAILENPDDDAAYVVYADWLIAKGDPRGELIMLQHDADEAEGPRKRSLQRAAKALLEKHDAYFLGPLPARGCKHDVLWRYGYVRKLAIEWESTRSRPTKVALSLLAEVLQHPSYRFVVDLQIGCVFDEYWSPDLQGVIDTLATLRMPACVRTLDLGVTRSDRVTTESAELGELVAALPRLRRVRLRERKYRAARPDDPVHEIMIQRARKKKRSATSS